ncbi:hypothetical protein HS088_TW13G00768 [Tripterygium wilfordii]|uniref:Uncharacterized protein n=1 Tax=Tripterygium wilfordii TaxID=458696 RepID=A0A7J7CUU7_TRIWF|nr:hypothetical protein HS088_TW13G00768 [Tripterygium wilfordii]
MLVLSLCSQQEQRSCLIEPKMVMRKKRATRVTPTQIEDYTSSDSGHGSEKEEEFLPEDTSSADDEELIAAREKIMSYRRGWRVKVFAW